MRCHHRHFFAGLEKWLHRGTRLTNAFDTKTTRSSFVFKSLLPDTYIVVPTVMMKPNENYSPGENTFIYCFRNDNDDDDGDNALFDADDDDTSCGMDGLSFRTFSLELNRSPSLVCVFVCV